MNVTQWGYPSNQGILEVAVNKLFSNEKILTNVRRDISQLHNPETGSPMEVDVWVPESNICFEFQDEHHYGTAWYAHSTTERVKHHDTIKSETLRRRDQSLIPVPFWWDGTDESLSSSVVFCRPDARLDQTGHPIPLNPPVGILSRLRVPDVGELMVASFPTDIITFANSVSVDNIWWMGEKYDGVRVCWHPNLHKPYTRSGLILEFPIKASGLCGGTFLDSEIWFGRGGFLETQKLVHTGSEAINWSLFRLIAFDVPDPSLRSDVFETRFKHLVTHTVLDHPFLTPTSRLLCVDSLHLKSAAKSVMNAGGEGIILRKPRSPYVGGRSSYLFKFKAAIEDAEALVMRISDSSCQLLLPNGVSFAITTQQMQHFRLARGDIVTFNYIRQGSNPISPANVQIFRIRKDLSWEDLLKKGGTYPVLADLNPESRSVRRARRLLLEGFAKLHNFDPLVPTNWYSVSRKLILQEHPGILVEYNGSLAAALLDVFPEIGLDRSSFNFLQKTHWNDVQNRRNFFLEISRRLNFDPLVANNWYSNCTAIKQSKRGRAVVAHHSGSYARALVDLFPEIGLHLSKFGSVKSKQPEEYWKKTENRILFFRNFAAYHYFDHLIPDNWYRVSKQDVLSSLKSAKTVLTWHAGQVSQALTSLFPDIGLDPSRFSKVRGNWYYERKRREFFMKFAAAKGFDPRVADNWLLVCNNDITAFENGDTVLGFHGGSLRAALSQLFSDLAFLHFNDSLSDKHFAARDIQKAFFDRFASSKHLDPLSPACWYLITSYDVQAFQYGRSILLYYKMDHKTALQSLYPQIGLDVSKFTSFSDQHWRHRENAVSFLRDFAATRGFDAESESHKWYQVTNMEIVATRYGKSTVWHHGGNIFSALRKLFPNQKLKLSRFHHIPDVFWNEPQNRRDLLEEFAENTGGSAFASFPYGARVLKYY